jgi:DNA-binding transcriptional ArsR family regulator
MNKEKIITQLVETLNSPFISALSDPVRIDIMKVLLTEGALDVNSIADFFQQDRSVISRHLSKLKMANIVLANKDGRHTFYSVNGKYLIAQVDTISKLFKSCYKKGCC